MLSTMALATIAGIGLASLQWASPYPESPHRFPGGGHHVRQAQVFESVEAMSAASDVVIRGTIVDVKPGRTLPGEAGGITFVEVTIRVDRVLAGYLSDTTVVLEVDNGTFPTIADDARTWPIAGDATILFLHRKTDRPTRWRPINSQGAYAVRANVLTAADPVDGFASSVAGFGALALEGLIASP